MRIDQQLAAVHALKLALGNLIADDPELLLDMIEGETDLLEMVDRILERIIEITMLGKSLALQIDIMTERKARFEDQTEKLRMLLTRAMGIVEQKKLERPLATLVMANRLQSVMIISESEIPAQYWVPQPFKLDKKALSDDLKAGQHIPGATLSNAIPSLTIRRS